MYTEPCIHIPEMKHPRNVNVYVIIHVVIHIEIHRENLLYHDRKIDCSHIIIMLCIMMVNFRFI